MPALDQVDAMEAGEAGPSSRRGSDPEPVTDALMVSGAGEFGGAQMAGSIPPSCNPSFAQWDNRAAPSRPSADLLQQRVDATDAMARHLARDGTAVDEIDDNDSGFGDSPGHTREPSPEAVRPSSGGADGSFSEEPSPSNDGDSSEAPSYVRRGGAAEDVRTLDERTDDALEAALSDAAAAAPTAWPSVRGGGRASRASRRGPSFPALNEARRASAIEAEDDMLRKEELKAKEERKATLKRNASFRRRSATRRRSSARPDGDGSSSRRASTRDGDGTSGLSEEDREAPAIYPARTTGGGCTDQSISYSA